MKRVLLLILLVASCVFVAPAQEESITVAAGRSYASSDTTPVVTVRPGDWVFAFWSPDTINVALTWQFATANVVTSDSSKVWSSYAIVADSTNSKVHAGYFKSAVLRGAGSNNIPAGTRGRLIVTKRPSGNPVGSKTYSAALLRE